jgi:hypothetical protein
MVDLFTSYKREIVLRKTNQSYFCIESDSYTNTKLVIDRPENKKFTHKKMTIIKGLRIPTYANIFNRCEILTDQTLGGYIGPGPVINPSPEPNRGQKG